MALMLSLIGISVLLLAVLMVGIATGIFLGMNYANKRKESPIESLTK